MPGDARQVDTAGVLPGTGRPDRPDLGGGGHARGRRGRGPRLGRCPSWASRTTTRWRHRSRGLRTGRAGSTACSSDGRYRGGPGDPGDGPLLGADASDGAPVAVCARRDGGPPQSSVRLRIGARRSAGGSCTSVPARSSTRGRGVGAHAIVNSGAVDRARVRAGRRRRTSCPRGVLRGAGARLGERVGARDAGRWCSRACRSGRTRRWSARRSTLVNRDVPCGRDGGRRARAGACARGVNSQDRRDARPSLLGRQAGRLSHCAGP